MELRKETRLYWLWASTYRLFFRMPPCRTDTCAVWRRIICLPLIWPAGLIFRALVYFLFILFLIGYFILGVPIGVMVGFRPYLATDCDGGRYPSMCKYSGWFVGPFELYPWHSLILAAGCWIGWIGWYGYTHWSDKHVPHSLQNSFWWTVVILGLAASIGLIMVMKKLLLSGVEWAASLKGKLCAPVKIVE